MTADSKKQIIHFSFFHGLTGLTACGADLQSRFSLDLKITDYRNKVTCKNCKATKRFRKIKC